MNVNLEQFVGQNVTVILRSGSTKTGEIQRTTSTQCPYWFEAEDQDYWETHTLEGRAWPGKEMPSDIVSIRPATSVSLDSPNLKELETQREQLVAQMESLDQKIAEAKKKVLPEGFDRHYALRCLDNPQDRFCLDLAFTWRKTPQGHDYWSDLSQGRRELTFEDIAWIQKWVINSLLREQESGES